MPWGWLKRGTNRYECRWYRKREWEHTVRHHDVPRFGALRRDNTPSPAEVAICNNSGYNQCSLSCFERKRKRASGLYSLLALSLLSLVGEIAITTLPSLTQEGYPGLL